MMGLLKGKCIFISFMERKSCQLIQTFNEFFSIVINECNDLGRRTERRECNFRFSRKLKVKCEKKCVKRIIIY